MGRRRGLDGAIGVSGMEVMSHLDAGNMDILFLTFFKLYVICAQF